MEDCWSCTGVTQPESSGEEPGLERGLEVVTLSEMRKIKGGGEVPQMSQLSIAVQHTAPIVSGLLKASHSVWSRIYSSDRAP